MHQRNTLHALPPLTRTCARLPEGGKGARLAHLLGGREVDERGGGGDGGDGPLQQILVKVELLEGSHAQQTGGNLPAQRVLVHKYSSQRYKQGLQYTVCVR